MPLTLHLESLGAKQLGWHKQRIEPTWAFVVS